MAVSQVALEEAPALVAPFGGLLDVATIQERADLGWINPADMYDSIACLDIGSRPGSPCETAVEKDVTTPHVWVDGTGFNAYGLLQCRSIGFGYDDAETKGRDAYTLAESRIVEKNVMEWHFGTSGANTVILTSGTPVSLLDGVALLEGYMGRYYSAVPTLHMSRTAASLLTARNGIDREGNSLFTKLGSKVAAGGGYLASVSPAGVAAPAGQAWLYATGEVVLRRGPLGVHRAFDEATNDVTVLAERMYVVSTDCLTAAVQVNAVFT